MQLFLEKCSKKMAISMQKNAPIPPCFPFDERTKVGVGQVRRKKRNLGFGLLLWN